MDYLTAATLYEELSFFPLILTALFLQCLLIFGSRGAGELVSIWPTNIHSYAYCVVL